MNESDIDHLLRQETPDITVRPGLETRIRATLHQAPKKRHRKLAWLALPAAALLALVLIIANQDQAPPSEVVTTPIEETSPPTVEVVKSFVPDVVEDEINPLHSETVALQNDAKRTGRFLLDCLPSLALRDK